MQMLLPPRSLLDFPKKSNFLPLASLYIPHEQNLSSCILLCQFYPFSLLNCEYAKPRHSRPLINFLSGIKLNGEWVTLIVAYEVSFDDVWLIPLTQNNQH